MKKKKREKESSALAAKRRQAPNGTRNKRRGLWDGWVFMPNHLVREEAARFAFLFAPFSSERECEGIYRTKIPKLSSKKTTPAGRANEILFASFRQVLKDMRHLIRRPFHWGLHFRIGQEYHLNSLHLNKFLIFFLILPEISNSQTTIIVVRTSYGIYVGSDTKMATTLYNPVTNKVIYQNSDTICKIHNHYDDYYSIAGAKPELIVDEIEKAITSKKSFENILSDVIKNVFSQ